jgi:hypothetical protein
MTTGIDLGADPFAFVQGGLLAALITAVILAFLANPGGRA